MKYTVIIFVPILISAVLGKDLRAKDQNNENTRQGKFFFGQNQGPPPPPLPGMLPPPNYYPRPHPGWAVVEGAGYFLLDMLDAVSNAIAGMYMNGGIDGPMSGYDYGGSDFDAGGYDDDFDGDYRRLPMPPPRF